MGSGLLIGMLIISCKSGNESAGDKYLKANDPINALRRYDMALEKGKVSKTFYTGYIQASILTLEDRAKADPSAEFLDALKDTIINLLSQHPNPESEAKFSQVLFQVGSDRIAMSTPDMIEGGLRLFKSIDGLNGASPEVTAKVAAVRKELVDKKLKEIQKEYEECVAGDPQRGIVADYLLTELTLASGETPESKLLWSQVRKSNLSTYLMYDLDGLLDHVDARINKYGVLIGIPKYEVTPTSLKIQFKAWNGSGTPFHFLGENVTLVDDKGQVYKPASKAGGFSKDKLIEKGKETPLGVFSFNFPANTVLSYIEFNSEAGKSRKYLP